MAARKPGLGKGLDSLIKDKVSDKITNSSKVLQTEEDVKKHGITVSISKVEPNREQPRRQFNEDSLHDLSESIKQHGILNPLLVQDKGDYFEIIAGERRWRAARLAGLTEVPIIIKDFTPRQILEVSLVENIQRDNLNPLEEAVAYKRLLDEFDLKHDEVAESVSKSRTTVTNSLRLLKLSKRVQDMLIDDMISTGHARSLLGINDEEQQYQIAQEIFDKKLSVRETEKLIKKLQSPKEESSKEKETSSMDVVYQDLEQRLKNILGTKVVIHTKNHDKGKIEIDYLSNEELERIMSLLQSIGHGGEYE